MNDSFYIRKLLSDKDIELILNLLSISSEKDWIDGLSTVTNGSHKIKKLKRLSNYSLIQKIHSIVMSSLDNDNKFLNFTVAKSTGISTITKMNVGDYYHLHHDDGFNGHYSTTLFLSEKEMYEGGELCLSINNEERKIKLNPGEAITYNTGILHKVNTITSGERLCIVFWSTSMINDPWMRSLYSSLSESLNYFDMNDYETSKFMIDGVRHSILRRHL